MEVRSSPCSGGQRRPYSWQLCLLAVSFSSSEGWTKWRVGRVINWRMEKSWGVMAADEWIVVGVGLKGGIVKEKWILRLVVYSAPLEILYSLQPQCSSPVGATPPQHTHTHTHTHTLFSHSIHILSGNAHGLPRKKDRDGPTDEERIDIWG